MPMQLPAAVVDFVGYPSFFPIPTPNSHGIPIKFSGVGLEQWKNSYGVFSFSL